MSQPKNLHRVTLWLCDECLRDNNNECTTFGCDRHALDKKCPLWDRMGVAVEGFTWEGCPTCHIEDDGGWAVRRDVDVLKCATCKGAGVVRVPVRDRSERPVAAPPPKCICMASCGWWNCPVHFPTKNKRK